MSAIEFWKDQAEQWQAEFLMMVDIRDKLVAENEQLRRYFNAIEDALAGGRGVIGGNLKIDSPLMHNPNSANPDSRAVHVKSPDCRAAGCIPSEYGGTGEPPPHEFIQEMRTNQATWHAGSIPAPIQLQT